jgi:predicted O-methyltransferase YrrM
MRECAITMVPEMKPEEHRLLMDSLRSLGGRRLHLEIGTAAGGTLCAMMQAFPAERRPQFVVVDPMKYFPNQLETVQRNLRQHQLDPSQVDFRAASSAQAFPQSVERNDQFDFILVDGCHRIESVTLDLKWTRRLVPGGLICFHDYEPGSPGVCMAVDRFLRKHPNYVVENHVASLLVVRKKSPSPLPEIDLSDALYAQCWKLPHRILRKLKRWNRAA